MAERKRFAYAVAPYGSLHRAHVRGGQAADIRDRHKGVDCIGIDDEVKLVGVGSGDVLRDHY